MLEKQTENIAKIFENIAILNEIFRKKFYSKQGFIVRPLKLHEIISQTCDALRDLVIYAIC